jgi:hypothetical protein
MTKNIASIALVAASILVCGCTRNLGHASMQMDPPTVPLDCADKILRGEDCAVNPALSGYMSPSYEQSSPISRARRN